MHALTADFQARRLRAAACALFCLLSSSALAFAETVLPEHREAYERMTEDQRVKTLVRLNEAGAAEQAQELLSEFPLQGPYAANRTLYIEGLILKAHGDFTGAVKKFRSALANDPKLSLVRNELAKTLVMLEEYDSAKHHLELLAGEAPDENSAHGLRSFIDSIDEKRPYSFSAYVSLAPSTNINNGSGKKTVYADIDLDFEGDVDLGQVGQIDEDSRKQAGVGVAAGINASYTKRLGNDFAFIAAGGIHTQVYDDLDFNGVTFSQSLELRHFFRRGSFGLGVVGSQSLDTHETKVTTYSYGPRVSANYWVSRKDNLGVSTVYEFRDFDADGQHDGTSWTNNASWMHAFDSATTATLYGRHEDVGNGVDYLSYNTWSAGLQVYRELPYGLTATTGLEGRRSTFDAVNPGFTEPREDKRLITGITFTKRDFNILGFAPQLNYTYVRNFSNIALYDYDSHSVDFRLTKEF